MQRVNSAFALAICLAFGMTQPASPQVPAAVLAADPAAGVAHPVLESSLHRPLPEQYIWLAMPEGTPAKTDGATARFFRRSFIVRSLPRAATLYISAPDQVEAFLNGHRVAGGDRAPNAKTYPLVVIAPVAARLRRGVNVLAIEARGRSPLAAKILPRSQGVLDRALVISGPGWRASLREQPGWQAPAFHDSGWRPAAALGSVDSDVPGYRPWVMKTSNLEWNSDSAMYPWPGYDGISPFLAHLPLVAVATRQVAAAGQPALLLDFGREINGRIELASNAAKPMRVTVRYGESVGEAENAPFLGPTPILIPPRATAYGPKSAFRYAILTFPQGDQARLKSARADVIYYPVRYRGSFESSDPLLNRIWAVGAYTARLCMQEEIWDAPKRDRMPWMGDLDVSGKVIDYAFADHFLMQRTMDWLIQETGDPVGHEVNTIPGYSAFWIMGEADYYRHSGDKKYLLTLHRPLIQLLDYMSSEMNAGNVFVNARRGWPFVDWSPGLEKDTPAARRATDFEFYRAFAEGAWLLGQMGDAAASARYQARARAVRKAARSELLDASTDTFGARWQTNAMAVYSGIAGPGETRAIWDRVLSRPSPFAVTPYYDYYAVTAMAEAGHRRHALDWIRRYWGGMIAEGATSFWEGYDPGWPKNNFHAHLQADDDQGYFVSLAHGWSSGPTAWLAEQILGVQPQAAGFQQTLIRPDLAGLAWARGTVPTPGGAIQVDYRKSGGLDAHLEIPAAVSATVVMPACGQTWALMNGVRTTGQLTEGGKRVQIHLKHGGAFDLQAACTR